MLKEFKEIIADYGVLGLIFGVLSIIIKPAKPWLDSFKDVVAAITLAIIVGLILKDTGLSDTTIFGVIGGCSCFARVIFEGFGRLLALIFEKPLYFFGRVFNIIRGRSDGSD